MIRQYNPQRFRYQRITAGNRSVDAKVGTIEVGTIVYLPAYGKCIVRAWHPREYCAARQDGRGRWRNTFMAGGHLATVERLSDRREIRLADHIIRHAIDC
jgi:hypothetical protein